jgi:threonyl-tRNA synthetase
MKITLKDGGVIESAQGASLLEIARQISEGLARAALIGEADGELRDLSYRLDHDAEIIFHTFDSEGGEGKKAYRHTAAHVLAQAVKRLFPQAKLAIGPAIENGFYYDIDSDVSFSAETLEKIEAEMRNIIKEDLPIEAFALPKEAALALMKDEPYKAELIRELPEGETISFYRQGEFTDLCRGPHLPATGKIKAFKLTQVAGAYWRGDEKNKMLQRIYGVAFAKKSDVTEHLARLEEAKKRDHNKLGRELGYFTTSEPVGQGLPLLMPKGAKVLQILQRFVEDEEEKRGYQLTKTPYMAKRELYQISGHWDHYRDGMFVLGDPDAEGEVLALRPMTCPFQYQIYNTETRSYRDLPIRYNETSTLFRNEASGEMHGLIRVRQFTLSEGHLMVTPEQLADEFRGVVDLIYFMMNTLGIEEDMTYRFSKWDENNREKYIGTKAQWDDAQNRMREILDGLGLKYTEADGEAAFYGPKLDVQFRNVHGKEDTLITVQIDFALAEKFGMTYIDSSGEKRRPYIIHRSSIGCYERTLAMLLEKYAGALPAWLAPEQVRVLPISGAFLPYAQSVCETLKQAGVRAVVDARGEKIGYKIREAQMEKIPYMLVVGEKEQSEGNVAVRSRAEGDTGAVKTDAFLEMILEEIRTKKNG